MPFTRDELRSAGRLGAMCGLWVGTIALAAYAIGHYIASGEIGVDAQLRRLATESLLPLCPLARAQSPPPPATPTPAPPSIAQTPNPNAGTSVPEVPQASPSATPPAPTVTALSPPPPQPGTDCRTPE